MFTVARLRLAPPSAQFCIYQLLAVLNGSGKHPIMMGPVMIHKQKKFKHTTSLNHLLMGLKSSFATIRYILRKSN